jgi:hypothetical protein
MTTTVLIIGAALPEPFKSIGFLNARHTILHLCTKSGVSEGKPKVFCGR